MNTEDKFHVVEISVSEITEDQPKQVSIRGIVIAVYRVGDEYYAVDDICTHEFAYLSEGFCENGIVECPLHQARFDVRTGETLGPPATTCLRSYRAEVCGTVVRVFVPEDIAEEERGRRRVTYVIVGTGEAGVHAAISLRANGYSGRILMIGEEPYIPYTRPALSKAVLVSDAPVLPEIFPITSLSEKRIELKLGTRVTDVDPRTRSIACQDGTRFIYEKLLLATGCRARRVSLADRHRPQFHYIRTFDDAVAVHPELRPGRRVVAIGGGYIGLEVAAAARHKGCQVTVLEQASDVMMRVVGPKVSAFLRTLHESHGVEIRTGAKVRGFERHGTGTIVRCDDGDDLMADLIVVGIGAEPCTELASAAGLKVDNGITVDEFGRTSIPDIFACGDVANHPNSYLGCRLRVESWQNAQQHASAVAAGMAGRPRPYALIPWFWTDQYDVNLQMIGCPTNWEESVLRGDPAGRSFTIIYLDHGRVVGGNAINRPRDIAPLRAAIEKKRNPNVNALVSPGVPLAQALRTETEEVGHVA